MQNLEDNNLKNFNAEYIAKLFKFYLQFKNPYIKFKLPFKRVSSKVFYSTYQKEFDKLFNVFSKYNLDIIKYINFFINYLDKRENDIKTCLVSNIVFSQYIEWLKKIDKQNNIYKYFVKSAKNIAIESFKLGYYNTKDFLRYLIKHKKIAEYFVSGKISIYYFAAIPNFNKIIPKLDNFAIAELKQLYDNFEMYNAEIIQAFIKQTNQKVNPISYTDELIFKIREKQNSK